MQEVAGVIESGIYDYGKLEGDTGPLVYPAGFVYIFGALYHSTDQGANIRRAQYIFMALYLIMLLIVFAIYSKFKKLPNWPLILLVVSKRIHSIFVLRLFNDCIAMLFLYLAILLFIHNKWSLGCFSYSVAVSIKMNILLFAPGLLLLLLLRFGVVGTIPKLTICAAIQLVLAVPFLIGHWWNYLWRSFDFGRKFFYIWTVNWKFVPENIFLSNSFALGLLILHLSLLLIFLIFKWSRTSEGLKSIGLQKSPLNNTNLDADYMGYVLFTSNFIGIVCARSLHFQFYVWYFHSLPFLIFFTNTNNKSIAHIVLRLVVFVLIEVSWNIFPSNWISSLILFVCHWFILSSHLFSTPSFNLFATPTSKAEKTTASSKRR
eukprot:TRINITY_DN1590_c0_g2_i1.p1 TRINITY_DN1590_c0_g2~~TRINITY_DN1590_c0_g2_i1.p1  ORF type:complete len:433 (-),score=101.35 TRINITY_DN1590_c0_g2_i1:146-1270(-)